MLRIGILGAADIAYRRFLPSIKNAANMQYAGVASREQAKAEKFSATFGGAIYTSYDALLNDDSIDAVYIPLPPALHFEWAEKALLAGKHVLLEKPFTTNLEDTKKLIDLAKRKQLALHENYMFLFHRQLSEIKTIAASGKIGELRLIRAAFGFPFRGANDFRYNKALGGGALLDCGGYPVRLALELLGDDCRIETSSLNYALDYDVDLYGSATLCNSNGLTAQIAFGMDNSYKCELEIWGSNGCIKAPRIFTAPSNLEPQIMIDMQDGTEIIQVQCDDQFLNSANFFVSCINDTAIRESNYSKILQQASLIDTIKEC